MDYYKPTLSLDTDYYYKKSTQTVYVKSNMSTGLPAGIGCQFNSVNPDPNDQGNFLMKYNADNNGTIYQDHTYTNSQDIPIMSNVIAKDAEEAEGAIIHELESIHKSCFTVSCTIYKPDGQEGGASSAESNSTITVIVQD